MNNKPGISALLSDIKNFCRLFRTANMKITHFSLSLLLNISSAFFEAVSLLLIVPTMKGILERNFDFIKTSAKFSIVKSVFPQITEMRQSTVFIILIALIFAGSLASSLLKYLSFITMFAQVRKFSKNLRREMFARYMSFGKLFFDSKSVGYLSLVLVNFTHQLVSQISQLGKSISALFLCATYLVLMAAISWKLLLVSSIVTPFIYYGSRLIISRVRKASSRYAKNLALLGAKISNSLSCIMTVKAASYEEKEKEWFNSISDKVAGYEYSMQKAKALRGPVYDLSMLLVTLFLLSVMVYIVFKQQPGALPAFLVFFYAMRRLITNIEMVEYARIIFATISGIQKHIIQAFDDSDKFFIPEGSKEFPGLREKIEVKDLTFEYPNGTRVLEKVSFEVAKGKMVAIVGPTGVGKTTIANILMRFYDTEPGKVVIDGTDIREFTTGSFHRKTALVSQESYLFNDTLRMNLTYGIDRELSEDDMMAVLKDVNLSEMVSALPGGLETEIGKRGIKLSGGEKQRLVIANAMLKGADLLILDEATSFLDSKTEKLVQDAIEGLIKNKTSVVIAHRLSTIKNADTIIVLEKEQIVEQGSLDELLARKGCFYEYWQMQKFD